MLYTIDNHLLYMFPPVFSAVYQGGLFGLCGMMPQKYTGAVMTGQVKHNVRQLKKKDIFLSFTGMQTVLHMLLSPPSNLHQYPHLLYSRIQLVKIDFGY